MCQLPTVRGCVTKYRDRLKAPGALIDYVMKNITFLMSSSHIGADDHCCMVLAFLSAGVPVSFVMLLLSAVIYGGTK